MLGGNLKSNKVYETVICHPLEKKLGSNSRFAEHIKFDRFGFWLNLFVAPLSLVPVSKEEGHTSQIIRIVFCSVALAVSAFALRELFKNIQKLDSWQAELLGLIEGDRDEEESL